MYHVLKQLESKKDSILKENDDSTEITLKIKNEIRPSVEVSSQVFKRLCRQEYQSTICRLLDEVCGDEEDVMNIWNGNNT